jgi:hypothetical protein
VDPVSTSTLELLCQNNQIELRKLYKDEPVTLAESKSVELSGGWHRIEFGFGPRAVWAKVDDRECINLALAAGKGCLGLRNYGDFAAFDNLTVQIVSTAEESMGSVKPVDQALVEIENSLLK